MSSNEPLSAASSAAPVHAPAVPPAGAHAGEPLSVSDRGTGKYYMRFTRTDRITHALMVVSFFGLVLTGVPLRFSYAPWARPLMELLGGTQTAGLIHRICGVITFAYAGLHLVVLVSRFLKARSKKGFFVGPRSMVPWKKDAQDVAGMFKWFFGRGPRPQFDRYNYLDKFDYWAEVWGVFAIGGSGLLLWFPTFFSLFLPGWIFNIATIIHGVEALIALGFIFTIHFFNVNLRPEKFPIDLVMFTGRAREEYFKEEHPLEYEREKAAGRLAELEVPPPTRAFYLWSLVGGFTALVIGLSTVGLIIYAVIRG
ncbi:MAG TPA: cytochrome b/b6 domain-containing protein [Gemmatimonadaceae bacterium]|nr:cytochrome b/b6 domain-containing protein [Gemmatimonadaceae bacterium]